MSKHHCVGRSSLYQLTLPLIIIIASSALTNIFAVFDFEYKIPIAARCEPSVCYILHDVAIICNAATNKVKPLMKDFLEKEENYTYSFQRTMEIMRRSSDYKMFNENEIPKIINISTDASVLNKLNEEITLEKVYQYLRANELRISTAQTHANLIGLLTSNGYSIFTALMKEAREVIHSFERLIPVFNVNVNESSFDRTYYALRFSGNRNSKDGMIHNIHKGFYEIILLMEFFYDMLNHFITKYCTEDFDYDVGVTYPPSHCKVN